MNSAPAVILSRDERTKLASLATDTRKPRALRKRAQAILLCAEGKTNLGVAGKIGITNLTVGRWRREFLLNRMKNFGIERRGRSVQRLVLSNAERGILQGWLRSPSVSSFLRVRARIILACARGAANIAVANETGVSKQTVSKLRQHFLSERLISLRPGNPGRRAARVTLSSDRQKTLEEPQ